MKLILAPLLKGIPTVFLCLFCNFLFSQSDNAIPQSDYQALLNRQFRLIMTGAGNDVIGNFASIDLSDAKRITFAPTFQLKNNNLLSAKFNAGISDGFADIFTNSGLNSNLSLSVDYNFLRRKEGRFLRFLSDTIKFSGSGKRRLESQTIEIEHKYKLDSISLVRGIERSKLLNQLISDSIKYRKAVIEANKELDAQRKAQGYDPDKHQDTLRGRVAIQEENLRYTTQKMKILREEEDWEGKQSIDIGNEKETKEAEASEKNIIVRGFRISWFTIGSQIRNDAFKLFDSSDNFADRIESKNFVSFQGKLRYSIFNWLPYDKKKNTWYMTFGLTYNFQSNYQDLTFSEINVTTDYGSNSSDNMTSVKKYNVYSGEYRSDIDEAVLSYDAYFFIKNLAAFHLFPLAKYTETYRPRYSMGFGFLYPLKNKVEKTIINAEVYANFVNLFRYTDNGFDLFQNYRIGLRFTVPLEINHVQKQKV